MLFCVLKTQPFNWLVSLYFKGVQMYDNDYFKKKLIKNILK